MSLKKMSVQKQKAFTDFYPFQEEFRSTLHQSDLPQICSVSEYALASSLPVYSTFFPTGVEKIIQGPQFLKKEEISIPKYVLKWALISGGIGLGIGCFNRLVVVRLLDWLPGVEPHPEKELFPEIREQGPDVFSWKNILTVTACFATVGAMVGLGWALYKKYYSDSQG